MHTTQSSGAVDIPPAIETILSPLGPLRATEEELSLFPLDILECGGISIAVIDVIVQQQCGCQRRSLAL